MRNIAKRAALCGTIMGLFVLACAAQSHVGLLGPEQVRVALMASAVLPPTSAEVTVADGPIFPPDPIDLPQVAAQDGPIFPPDPVDLPAVAVQDGPIFPPDPVDLPAVTVADGPIFPPDPVDLPGRTDGPIFPPDPVDLPA